MRNQPSPSFQSLAAVLCSLLMVGISPSAHAAISTTPLLDSRGSMARQIPSVSTSKGVVAIVSSPGTPSVLPTSTDSSSSFLSLLEGSDDGVTTIVCRGATLNAASTGERMGLTTTALVAGAVVVDGITEGDVENGLRNSRHARTLTAMIRTRLVCTQDDSSSPKQTMMLGVAGEVDSDMETSLQKEVQTIFDAVSVEREGESIPPLNELFDVVVVSVQSESDGTQLLSSAATAAAAAASSSDELLSQALMDAQNKIKASGVASEALDSPAGAQAFLLCRQAYAKQAKAVRAKLASWKSRVIGRGLLVDSFGKEASALYEKTLATYDAETLVAAGLSAPVASYRLEMRMQLQVLTEVGIQELHAAQVSNVGKSVLKKFNAKLLKQGVEASNDDNAAAMRAAAFDFEQRVEALDIPALSLTKDKPVREMAGQLNEALLKFPDSPAAVLSRQQKVTKTTSRERKPNSRAIDLGLDLVAFFRPDGLGSFQGFASYNAGGNSVIVGVQNDADDPTTIAQMGGVRPPFLKVQPKLRVDVEM